MASETIVEVKKSTTNWNLFWKDVDYTIPVSEEQSADRMKQVLAHCSGQVKAGEIIAILGPSGAGKTTLLNVLAGRAAYGKVQGLILANGRKRNSSWKRVAAYVEQEDILYADLTVREILLFAAKLRLPAAMSEAEKVSRADEIIRVLGLNHIADSRIGSHEKRGISGGERKRVSIAVELVSDPGIIFLDEPTSGLDSFIATTVSEKVKELAKNENKAVLLTIHQPRIRILNQFDKIILMSQGQIIFFGSVPEAMEHFKSLGFECPMNENPADYFLDLITVDRRTLENTQESMQRIQNLSTLWAQKAAQMVEQVPVPSAVKEDDIINAGFFTETLLLSKRFLTVKFRDWRDTVGAGFQIVVTLIGLFFLGPKLKHVFNFTYMQICVIFQLFLGMQLFTTLIPFSQAYLKDRDIIRRERSSSTYGPLACYFGKFISIMPMQILYAAISCAFITYGSIIKDPLLKFVQYFITVVLMNSATIAFALIIAATFKSTTVGARLGTLTFVLFWAFNGAIMDSEVNTALGFYVVNYTSPCFYAYNAFKSIHKGASISKMEVDMEWYWCWAGLFGLFTVYSAISWIALKLATKPKIKLD